MLSRSLTIAVCSWIVGSSFFGCSNPGAGKTTQKGTESPSSSGPKGVGEVSSKSLDELIGAAEKSATNDGDKEQKIVDGSSGPNPGSQVLNGNASSASPAIAKVAQNSDLVAANSADGASNTAVAMSQVTTSNFLSKAAADEQMNRMIKQVKEAGAGGASESQIATILDFLIQDVCLDNSGAVTNEDPAKCPRRRNAAHEDFLPYVKIDIGQEYPKETKAGWQRSDSVPLLDKNGNWRIMKTFDFGGPRMPDKQWGKFEDFQDGYDATELAGKYVSYMMTKDGTGDNYWSGSDCALNDGWILFPWDIQRNLPGNISHDIFNIGVRQVCQPASKNRASAAWNWLSANFPFTGGQSLETISTHHWSHESSLASTSFELNYYTREYGATRWESWEKCANGTECVAPEAANGCNGNTLMTINSESWRRVGCRDWTFIQAGTVPFPTFWEGLVTHRICLYGTGNFGDGKTCL